MIIYIFLAFLGGCSTINFFKICSSLNPNCGEAKRSSQTSIFLGCRPVVPRTLSTLSSFIIAMNPGNALIIFYNETNNSMGHYVTLWQQKNDKGQLHFFYYDPMASGGSKLISGDSTEELERNMQSKNMTSIFKTTSGYRTVYVFNLPLEVQRRKATVTSALDNLNTSAHFILTNYLKLDEIISSSHSFFTSPQFVKSVDPDNSRCAIGNLSSTTPTLSQASTTDGKTLLTNSIQLSNPGKMASQQRPKRKSVISSLHGAIKPGKYSKR